MKREQDTHHITLRFDVGERNSPSNADIIEAIDEWLDDGEAPKPGACRRPCGRPMRQQLSTYIESTTGAEYREWRNALGDYLNTFGYTIQDMGNAVHVYRK